MLMLMLNLNKMLARNLIYPSNSKTLLKMLEIKSEPYLGRRKKMGKLNLHIQMAIFIQVNLQAMSVKEPEDFSLPEEDTTKDNLVTITSMAPEN